MVKYLLLFLMLPCLSYAGHNYPKKKYSAPTPTEFIQSDKIKLYLSTPKLANKFKGENIKNKIRLQDVGTWLLMHEHLSHYTEDRLVKFGLILSVSIDDIYKIQVRDMNIKSIVDNRPAIQKLVKFNVQALTGKLNPNILIMITLPYTLKSEDGIKFIKLKVLVKTLDNKFYYNIFKFTYLND